MIRSYPWSRYEVRQARPPRRRWRLLLLLLPFALVLGYLALHLLGVNWTHAQAVPLLDLAEQRWELYWAPDQIITALQHHDLRSDVVSNLVLVRWR